MFLGLANRKVYSGLGWFYLYDQYLSENTTYIFEIACGHCECLNCRLRYKQNWEKNYQPEIAPARVSTVNIRMSDLLRELKINHAMVRTVSFRNCIMQAIRSYGYLQ